MNKDKTVSIIFCTSPPDQAERLARFLVENRYAACVNILGGVTSVYRWKGKVEQDSESLLLIKCPRRCVASLTEALLKEHPYDVPEVVSLPIESGSEAYLKWVLEMGG